MAHNVPNIGGAFGAGYYLQSKVSDDSGADVPVGAFRLLNLYGKNRLFGIGPDVTMAIFQKGGARRAARSRARLARSCRPRLSTTTRPRSTSSDAVALARCERRSWRDWRVNAAPR